MLKKQLLYIIEIYQAVVNSLFYHSITNSYTDNLFSFMNVWYKTFIQYCSFTLHCIKSGLSRSGMVCTAGLRDTRLWDGT